jgi:hypothetical protein
MLKIEKTDLQNYINNISSQIADLKNRPLLDAFTDDLYDAVSYWLQLSQWLIEDNTKIDYNARASEELLLLEQLENTLSTLPLNEQRQYYALLALSKQVLSTIAQIQMPPNGHMGVLKIIKDRFFFLQNEYGFTISKCTPLGIKYSSGEVYVDIEFAENSSLCCTFGPERNMDQVFWPEDLLYLYKSKEYELFENEQRLNNVDELERRFDLIAGVLHQYGYEVLRNELGIFERLQRAQNERNVIYNKLMDEKESRPKE